jgi:hypothetical protein
MSHLFFALFADERNAWAAIDELRRIDRRRRLTIHLHKNGLGEQANEIETSETHGWEGAMRGILIGAIGAMLLIALLFAVHIVSRVAVIPALILAIVGGGLAGGLGGMLYGEASPDRVMEEHTRAHEIVVSVDAPDTTSEEIAEQVTIRHGARVEHKPVLR